MNMFKPSKATTVKEYLAAVPDSQKDTVAFLHAFIQKAAPSLKSHFSYNMLGYGSFPYTNSKKQTLQWHTVGLAAQKNYVSLYVCCTVDGAYVAEAHKKQLGNVKVGKSCISFKKLDDLDLDTLKKVLKMAEKHPGFGGLAAARKPSPSKAVKDGVRCMVMAGTHEGKSGTVRDIKTSKTGAVTITMVQANGERFKTLAKNVRVSA